GGKQPRFLKRNVWFTCVNIFGIANNLSEKKRLHLPLLFWINIFTTPTARSKTITAYLRNGVGYFELPDFCPPLPAPFLPGFGLLPLLGRVRK
ncbi:MAG: hypothetical protein KDH95_11245, partial [Calditrichaeota bacterium]|nr:hypothetical protein [Calditrichota bacterium]